jgi:hypothetical protein
MVQEGLRTAFERDGFVIVKGVFGRAEVAELEAEFDRIVAQIVRSGEDVEAR